MPSDGGDAGERLDSRAVEEYRRRLETLDHVIEEAEGFNDPERAERARAARALFLRGEWRHAPAFSCHR